MSDVAAPAPVAAPQEAPVNAGRPTFNHPAIPPVRGGQQLRAQAPETKPDPVIATEQKPAAEVAPLEAKADEPAAEEVGEEEVQYFPDDEFTVTVDGKEQTVTMAKLLASYQRNEAANARFTEAKAMVRNAESLVRQALSPQGFVEFARKAGVDPYEIAESIVLERYNYERMSPQEREMHDYKREREQWERQRQAQQQSAEQQKQQAEAQAFQQRFLETTVATMDRLKVPGDPGLRNELIGRAAAIFRADLQAGYENTPQQAMHDAWTEYQERLSQHAKALPIDRRLSEEERQRIAATNAQERVRVAQAAPKVVAHTVRDENTGKFAPKPKPKMDMWNPTGNRR